MAATVPTPTPPSAGKVRIIDRVKVPSPDPGRVGKFDYMVTYIDEAMRAGVVTMWAELLDGKSEVDQERIIAERIKAEIAERVKWTGREISVR
jgi:hypothetical protein